MATVPGMRIELAPADPAWPGMFASERDAIVGALGAAAVRVEHVGSTSVPGLAAKPTIDIVLCVPDSSDEDAYVPALEAIGFVFLLREPDWFEHRLLRREPRRVNLHVFTDGCSEVAAMTGFRDWLRTHPDDLRYYEETKRRLAEREWDVVQDYADAKTDVVREIQRRAGI